MELHRTFLIAVTLWCYLSGTVQCRSFKADIYSSLRPNKPDPEKGGGFHVSKNALNSSHVSASRRDLSGYGSSNPIDDCWRGDSNWADNRMKLADCAVGFGSNAVGGKNGKMYVVTDAGDDAVNPTPGTLRYGVVQLTPLWIVFERDMTIVLKNELIMTSDKTLDGRGFNIHIANGPCITIQDVSNVIVHGLNIHDCKPGSPGNVISSTAHTGYRIGSDGDGITVFTSKDIWIDHNSFASCTDGLVDVIHASTGVTISNNVFMNHDKVMLLGHDDANTPDKAMKVTVAYNRFGPGCVQRMPRCRLGYFEVLNNDYLGWEMYAIGGSANPTIISRGNRYQATNNPDSKEVTKRDCSCGPSTWDNWDWTSSGDQFLDGAFFVESGPGGAKTIDGNRLSAASSFVPSMTVDAGVLSCSTGEAC